MRRKERPADPTGGAGLFFDPSGVFWRVNRESALGLGAGAALLLQLAHPLVAAGVDEHSDFRERPLRRLYRTMRAMQRLTFGDTKTAAAAARGLHEAHRRVRGVLRESTPVFPAGTPYRADEPALRLWVHATLVETILVTHDALLPPLSPAERESYYAGSRRLAALLGIPRSIVPPDLAAFRRYFDAMIAGPVLAVTPTTRRLAAAVLDPPLWWVPRALGRWNELATAALLPPRLRSMYGLAWDDERAESWERWRRRIGAVLRRLPDPLRAVPAAQWAELRARLDASRLTLRTRVAGTSRAPGPRE